jgi:hypothetical protein
MADYSALVTNRVTRASSEIELFIDSESASTMLRYRMLFKKVLQFLFRG